MKQKKSASCNCDQSLNYISKIDFLQRLMLALTNEQLSQFINSFYMIVSGSIVSLDWRG